MGASITVDLIRQVKPGLPYLDIIRLLRDNSALPIAAYQVSSLAHTRNSEVFPFFWLKCSCSLFEVEVWCELPMLLLYPIVYNLYWHCTAYQNSVLIAGDLEMHVLSFFFNL